MDAVKIDFLKNHPAFAVRLAELCGEEWEHLYLDWDHVVALREFTSHRDDARLPLSLVAIAGSELLGTVSLVFNDLRGYEHLNPWLASLLVLPEHRSKGVGSCLVREAERLLVLNRVPRAHLFTETASRYFERLDWTALMKAPSNNHPVVIFTKDFRRQTLDPTIEKAAGST